jgi:glutathione S-transferase
VDEHDRRAAAGDAVDDAPAVQLDLPLVELRREGRDGDGGALAAVPSIVLGLPGCQRPTSRLTLAKGHNPPPVLRLVTIPISHYCEKARWALERAGLEYREERHVQGIHRIAARRAGGGATVPVLVTPQGAIGESAAILAWVDGRTAPEHRLYPDRDAERREVRELCERFDAELGPSGRRLIYVHMLAQRELMLRFNDQGVPAWEDRALRWGWPLLVRFVARALAITPGIEREDEATAFRELDFAAALLADGRPYLAGERFSAADLTFAALCAPLVVPEAYGVPLPQPHQMAATTAALVRRAREHPAGAFALRVIDEHRRATVA